MKKLLFVICCFSFLQGCGQKKERVSQNPHITANNIVEEISKQVKNYPSEKIYKMRYSNDRCYFEMFVNGIRVHKNSNRILSNTAVEINHLLFKSGKYKVSYKMYPMYKVEDYDEALDTLVDETELKLILKSYDKKNEQADDIEYLTHEVPKTEVKKSDYYSEYKFVGSGKTYYEGNFDISVDVPYSITPPFANAQDLRKMDRKELEKRVLKEYQKLRQIYLNKEKDNIAKLAFDRLKDDLVTRYASENQVQTAISEMNEILIKSDIDILPIEKYKMEILADGKLVALFKDDSDQEIRGGNVLICKIKSGEYNGSIFDIKHYLYIPKGETEFKVY